MNNGSNTTTYLCKMIGVTGIGVGIAWALQILGFAATMPAGDKLIWILAAASIAGASSGLILVSEALGDSQATVRA